MSYFITPEEIEAAKVAIAAGKPVARIAQETGRSARGLRLALQKAGVKTPNRIQSGAMKHILSDDQEAELCRRYKAGEDAPTLAPSFNISAQYVYKVLIRHKVDRRDKSVCHKRETMKEDAFQFVSEASAYWAGFLMADGCVTPDSSGLRAPKVGLDLAKADRSAVDDFREFLGSSHLRWERIHKPLPSGTVCESIRIEVRSNRLAADLAKYGVTPNKQTREKATPLVEDNVHFWRGVFDGDGGYTADRKDGTPHAYLCGSKTLLEQFCAFLKRRGVKPPSVSVHKSIFQLALYGDAAREWIGLAYGEATVFLKRKHEAAMRCLKL